MEDKEELRKEQEEHTAIQKVIKEQVLFMHM
jgi:hypothetical protein